MPRKLRIQYPGAIYHVMNRGDRREDIFRDDKDRERFLSTLAETCRKTEWQVHAYCLMRNHFHLVIETPQPNLVAGMKWLLGVYTKRFNIRHKLRCDEQHPEGSPKGHPHKTRIARKLRQETTMTLAWIAHRLRMGAWTYVSNLLRENK